MRFAIVLLGLLSSFAMSAQAQTAPTQIPPDCQFQVNPHSYACTSWTFDGNTMFPLITMNLAALSGSWRATTFVDPSLENDGPEFAMFVNADRPTVPMGVLDKSTQRDLGDLEIGPRGITQSKWRGLRIDADPGSVRIADAWSVQFTFTEAPYTHAFTCRDFVRNGTQHLLCSWDILMPNNPQWLRKGFFGYLR